MERLNDIGIYRILPLESLPPDFSFPPGLASFIRHDSTSKQLVASRYLSEGDRVLLRNASEDPPYQAALVDLFNLQEGLQGKITYNQLNHELEFTGNMTTIRRRRLEEVSSDLKYRQAIVALFDSPRNFVKRYMRRFSVPRFYTTLDALPANVRFPSS